MTPRVEVVQDGDGWAVLDHDDKVAYGFVTWYAAEGVAEWPPASIATLFVGNTQTYAALTAPKETPND